MNNMRSSNFSAIGQPEKLTPYNSDFIFNNQPLLYRNSKGEVIPNPWFEKTTPYWLNFDTNAAGTNRLLLAANASGIATMTNDHGADMAIHSLAGSADSTTYQFQITDYQVGRTMANRFIHAATVIGTGLQPFKLPLPIVLQRTQQLTVDIQNGGTANATLGVGQTFLASRYYWEYEKYAAQYGIAPSSLRPYFYTTDNDVSLAANTTEQAFTTIMADAYFYLHRITFFSSQGTSSFNVQMSRVNSTVANQNSVTPSETFGGSNIFYWDLPEPMVFSPKERIQFTLQDRSGAVNNIFITMTGVNYYYKQGLGELAR